MKTTYSKLARALACAAAALCLFSNVAQAESTYVLDDEKVHITAHNYDWDTGNGMVVVNKKRLKKKAFDQSTPAEWSAVHGSVTFNQYGVGFPMGGMNEEGLVITSVWQDAGEYSSPDERPSINILEWIQYQLDTKKTVGEVLEGLQTMRLSPYAPKIGLEYLVSDADGASAVIEISSGEARVYTGEELKIPTLDTATYENAVKEWQERSGYGTDKRIDPLADDSTKRMLVKEHREEMVEMKSNDFARENAFEMLAESAKPKRTQWAIVYDKKNRVIYWRTAKNAEQRHVRIANFDLDCGEPRMVLDVDKGTGDVEKEFQPFSLDLNRDLLLKSAAQTTAAGMNTRSETSYQPMIMHPMSQLCP